MGIYVIIIKKRNNTKIAYTGERRKFGKPQVDLFAGAKLTHWQLWFSLTEWDSVLGEDAEAHDLYYHLLYAFLPLHYINSLMTVLWCLWKRHGTAINHNSTRAKLVIPTVEVPAAAHGGCWTEMGISKICLYVSNHLRKKEWDNYMFGQQAQLAVIACHMSTLWPVPKPEFYAKVILPNCMNQLIDFAAFHEGESAECSLLYVLCTTEY